MEDLLMLLETCSIAGLAVGCLMIKEQLIDSTIRKLRNRAMATSEYRPAEVEAAPSAGTRGAAVEVEENYPTMKHTLVHCPETRVYTKSAPIDGIRIEVPVPESTRRKKKPKLSRRNRALWVVAARRGEVDFSTWSLSEVTELFGASPRSVSEASKHSQQVRQDIEEGRRPLFPPHSSVTALSPLPATVSIDEMPREVRDALGVILEEFGECDLESRLSHLAESDCSDDNELGKQLERDWKLVEDWYNANDVTIERVAA
jgi:hypothetical protein